MTFTTSQLCDQFSNTDHVQIAEPLFKAFGGKTIFSGQITTLKVFEDDVLVKQTLSEKVTHRVLVIDGGGSHRCALLDYELAKLASENGWEGLVIYGCIRNSIEMNTLPIAVRALHAQPMYSHKRGIGEKDNTLTFAGVNFKTNHFLYADADGIIVCETLLS